MPGLRAIRRKRRRIARVASAIVVAGAFGGALLVVGGSGGGRRIDAAGAAAAANGGAGVSVDLPAGWQELPVAVTTAPKEILVVGTAPRPEADPINPCDASAPLPPVTAFLSIYEYASDDQLLLLPGGGKGSYTNEAFQPRPVDFTVEGSAGGYGCSSMSSSTTDSSVVVTTVPGVLEGTYADFLFTDAGRRFVARIITSGDTGGALFQTAIHVLNTLHVDPLAPTSTTEPATEPATAPGDQAAARQAITDAFRGAFSGDGPVSHGDAVEGGFPLSQATQDSAGAANANVVGRITVRINSLRFVDATHAAVNFDLLVDGNAITANTDGTALVEGGTWKIARDTFCTVVTRGGVPCPG